MMMPDQTDPEQQLIDEATEEALDGSLDDSLDDESPQDDPQDSPQGNSAFGRIEIAYDEEDKLWFWMAFGRNGKPVAQNVDGVRRRSDLVKTIKAVQDALPKMPLKTHK
jgi:hypothetical protein